MSRDRARHSQALQARFGLPVPPRLPACRLRPKNTDCCAKVKRSAATFLTLFKPLAPARSPRLEPFPSLLLYRAPPCRKYGARWWRRTPRRARLGAERAVGGDGNANADQAHDRQRPHQRRDVLRRVVVPIAHPHAAGVAADDLFPEPHLCSLLVVISDAVGLILVVCGISGIGIGIGIGIAASSFESSSAGASAAAASSSAGASSSSACCASFSFWLEALPVVASLMSCVACKQHALASSEEALARSRHVT